MRKIYLFASTAVAATMLAACSNSTLLNEIQEEENAQAIAFSTFSEKSTRATESSNLEAYHETFKVFGTKNNPNMSPAITKPFDGVICTNSSATPADVTGEWKYAPARFWDKQATYKFVAFAPENAPLEYTMEENSEVGQDTITFSSNGTITLCAQNLQQETPNTEEIYYGFTGGDNKDFDLMTSSTNPVVEENGNSHSENVPLVFKHILSKMNVKIAKGENLNDATLKIKEISIDGLQGTGTYMESKYEKADVVGETSGWTASGDTDYKLKYTNESGFEVKTNVKSFLIESLVIPQTIPAKAGDEIKSKLTIKYEITTGEDPNAYTEQYINVINFEPFFHNFMDRNKYTLTVTINPDVIKFDATVTLWNDEPNATFVKTETIDTPVKP